MKYIYIGIVLIVIGVVCFVHGVKSLVRQEVIKTFNEIGFKVVEYKNIKPPEVFFEARQAELDREAYYHQKRWDEEHGFPLFPKNEDSNLPYDHQEYMDKRGR